VSMANVFYIFPGQGSQYRGMGADLIAEFPVARDVYARASEVVGYDLVELSCEDPREAINQTRFTQPALLTHEIACYETFRSLLDAPCEPVATAGHSLGEYAALVAAGALTFEAALALVAERGRLMSELGRGAMLATTLDLETAQTFAERYYCGVGGHNLPEQTVVAGKERDLDALTAALAASHARTRAIRLNTEGAFHTYLMINAALEFRPVLERTELDAPAWPVLSNLTGLPHDPEPDAIRARLFFQLFNPVRWVDCMTSGLSANADTIVEFGGGIGKGDDPADKRPNLESIVKKTLKWQTSEAQYLAAINAATIREAARVLSGH
jgi:[acyl-carrier-protein] S-malonyltransferase